MHKHSVLGVLAKSIARKDFDDAYSIVREYMPSGSGIDGGTTLVVEDSKADKIVLTFGYHHMNEHGFYTHWTHHKAIITPRFDGEYDIRITGRDRDGFKDYLYDTFDHALTQSYRYNSLLAFSQ